MGVTRVVVVRVVGGEWGGNKSGGGQSLRFGQRSYWVK